MHIDKSVFAAECSTNAKAGGTQYPAPLKLIKYKCLVPAQVFIQ